MFLRYLPCLIGHSEGRERERKKENTRELEFNGPNDAKGGLIAHVSGDSFTMVIDFFMYVLQKVQDGPPEKLHIKFITLY